MKILGIILIFIIGFLGYFYSVGDKESSKPSLNHSANNNYDGSYTISYSDIMCGEYGYRFKLMHERDSNSSSSLTRKSNCRRLTDGSVEGYIYPAKAPQLRVFWVVKDGKLFYKD